MLLCVKVNFLLTCNNYTEFFVSITLVSLLAQPCCTKNNHMWVVSQEFVSISLSFQVSRCSIFSFKT